VYSRRKAALIGVRLARHRHPAWLTRASPIDSETTRGSAACFPRRGQKNGGVVTRSSDAARARGEDDERMKEGRRVCRLGERIEEHLDLPSADSMACDGHRRSPVGRPRRPKPIHLLGEHSPFVRTCGSRAIATSRLAGSMARVSSWRVPAAVDRERPLVESGRAYTSMSPKAEIGAASDPGLSRRDTPTHRARSDDMSPLRGWRGRIDGRVREDPAMGPDRRTSRL